MKSRFSKNYKQQFKIFSYECSHIGSFKDDVVIVSINMQQVFNNL